MEYRKLPHGSERVSVIGLGTSVVGEHSVQNVVETVTFALDSGVNYIDLAGGHAAIFPGIGEALAGRRKDAYVQLHFGADYTSGEYGWNPTLDGVKKSVAWQLEQLKTDYIDFGFMHCLDEIGDLEDYERNGILHYLLDLKAQGVVRHIGLSTHAPKLANRVLDMGILDMMMFSINPMYDYGHGEFSIGSASERYSLYTRCEKEGVGISVMKPFNAGQLLDAKKSPFGQALTPAQCIQYALDRPAVLTVQLRSHADRQRLRPGSEDGERKRLLSGQLVAEGRGEYAREAALPHPGAVINFNHVVSLLMPFQDCVYRLHSASTGFQPESGPALCRRW